MENQITVKELTKLQKEAINAMRDDLSDESKSQKIWDESSTWFEANHPTGELVDIVMWCNYLGSTLDLVTHLGYYNPENEPKKDDKEET